MYLLTTLIIILIHNVSFGMEYIFGGVLDDSQTWDDAEDLCLSQFNTHLASIHSEEDNKKVAEICEAYKKVHSGDFCWIGLQNVGEIRTDGIFEWSDGNAVNYLNWATTSSEIQPNFGGDCVIMTMKHSGAWNDRSCDNPVASKFICNKPSMQLLNCYYGNTETASRSATKMCRYDQNRCSYKVTNYDSDDENQIYERSCSDSDECSRLGCRFIGDDLECCCASNLCNA